MLPNRIGLVAMKKLQHEHLYGNCIMLAPDGQTLCLCDQKKIDWYLSRNLAVLVNENPKTIQLTFVPKGNGKADYPYYTSEKKNICVCCSSCFELTKHHCVPRCFRKYFPKEYKSHSCHDVVLLCKVCHVKYEEFAQQLKKKLINEYCVKKTPPLKLWCGTPNRLSQQNKELYKAISASNALLNYNKIPLQRIQILEQRVKDYLKKDIITEDDLKSILLQDLIIPVDNFGKTIVEKLIDIPEFIVMWRRHFVDIMKPKYLPEFWDVEYEN